MTVFRKLPQNCAANITRNCFPFREGSWESNASPLQDCIWGTKAALSPAYFQVIVIILTHSSALKSAAPWERRWAYLVRFPGRGAYGSPGYIFTPSACEARVFKLFTKISIITCSENQRHFSGRSYILKYTVLASCFFNIYRLGQKYIYSCKYPKHRVYSFTIIY